MISILSSTAFDKYQWKPDTKKDYPRFNHLALSGYPLLPDVMDMRPHLSAVEDQGDLGSCTGNALVGAMEYLENKSLGFENDHPNFVNLSRLFVYFNERMMEGTINKDDGALICDGVMTLSQYGVCSELIWPYTISQYKLKPPDPAYTEALTRRITVFSKVDQTNEALRRTLAAGNPIVVGITLYDSFESDAVAADGKVPMPNTRTEKCLGGHAVLICGYDHINQVYIVRNSWGPDWGDKGYFYLPYDYVESADFASDFWVLNQ
jgi:C1A family cysteine protease